MTTSHLLQRILDFPPDTVVRDFVVPGTAIRVMIRRGVYSFCAYLAVREDHVLAGIEAVEIQCHYGVNFRQWGEAGTPWEPGWYWWGWDYGHCTDMIDTDAMLAGLPSSEAVSAMQVNLRRAYGGLKRKDWHVDEIEKEAKQAAVLLHKQLDANRMLLAKAMDGLNQSRSNDEG